MILPDKEQFNYEDCVIAGDECWLITPAFMGVDWTDENARFRSCIVRKSDNFVVSQGFKKFTNFGEKPTFQPWDKSWKFEARHKLDGSLLIVSRYKGQWILRTRGTVDAREMANGHEIDILIKKYSKLFADTSYGDIFEYSYLFEWTTPLNVIVLREHDEPTLTLVGMVNNDSGYYVDQTCLDIYAKHMEVDRPQKYEYNSIEECILDVAAWKGKEGVVLYSPDGQTLKKIKADEYLELHKISTGIKNVNQVLDLFMSLDTKFTEWSDFYIYVEITLSYEVAEKIQDYMRDICKAYCKVGDQMLKIVEESRYWKTLVTRKDMATAIMEYCKNLPSWCKAWAFNCIDNKPMEDKLLRKAMEEYLNE